MKRLESMAEVIKEELARQVSREVELPEGILLTITRIEITDDKQQAGVFISLLAPLDKKSTKREKSALGESFSYRRENSSKKNYLTGLGGSDNTDEMRRQILDLLFKTTPFLQRMLNRKLRTRPVPRIRFLIDEEELKRQRIEELLGQVEKNEL